MKNTKIIAVSGKGGVGKTSVSAAFVRLLSETYPESDILAIDADPAIGLATALGVEVHTTLDDIRKAVVTKAENGQPKAAVEMLSEARFRVLDTIVEGNHFSFLAIGRPESAGCYCKVNAYLKEVISLLKDDFDYIIIDGEAGIEQVNRRVMERVTHLVLLSDASQKGLSVARTIRNVADELVMYEQCGIILNRIPDRELVKQNGIDETLHKNGINLLSVIENDTQQINNDISGKSVFALSCDSPILKGAEEALRKMEIL